MPYIFKHWFSTIFIAPLVAEIFIYLSEYNSNFNQLIDIDIYPITIIFGLLFSLPTYIILAIILKFLEKRNESIWIIKTIFAIVLTLGITISFNLIFNNREPNICLGYIFTSTFFGYFYNLEKSNDDND